MKILNRIKQKKSWCLNLIQDPTDPDTARLVAADSNTGATIAYIIVFCKNGKVQRNDYFMESLKLEGYDPFEYNNGFEKDGKLEIW